MNKESLLTKSDGTQSSSRRSEIIGAATELFDRQGYHASSMRSLANCLNIKASSLYNHFSSKDEILIEICKIAVLALNNNVQRAIDLSDDLSQRIKDIVIGHGRMMHELGSVIRVYQSEQIHLPKPAADFCRDEHLNFLSKIDGVFRAGLENGEVRALVDAKSARLCLIGILVQINRMEHEYPSAHEGFEKRYLDFVDIFINGVSKNPASVI